MPVEVRCFGDQRIEEANLKVTGYKVDTSDFSCPKPLRSVFGAVRRCTDFNTTNIDADLVHCHTWYSHFGGILAKKNYGIPLVITVHSLEPLRPWKREQLAGGYDFSLWVEKTALEMADAVIAVSSETRRDIERLFDVNPMRVHVIHNGIDLHQYRKADSTAALKHYGIDPDSPYLLFIGRITRQKGFQHLIRAIQFMDRDFQIVLCAAAPDTPGMAEEMETLVEHANAQRPGIIWIDEMVDQKTRREVQLECNCAEDQSPLCNVGALKRFSFRFPDRFTLQRLNGATFKECLSIGSKFLHKQERAGAGASVFGGRNLCRKAGRMAAMADAAAT